MLERYVRQFIFVSTFLMALSLLHPLFFRCAKR